MTIKSITFFSMFITGLALIALRPLAAADLTPKQAMVTVCFTPAERCVGSIVAAIAAAKSQVRVQAYGFTSPPILGALAAAKRRGVDVAIVLDKVNDRDEEGSGAPPRGRYTGATYMSNAGIPVWIDDTVRIAHNKAIIIDGHLTIGGSYNYTMSAETRNAENVTFTDSRAVAEMFLSNWQARKSVSHYFSSARQ